MTVNRRTLSAIFILLVAIGATYYFVFHKEKQFTNYPSEGKDIVAFGDSLVEGVGASSRDKGFVTLLSKKIGKPIINLGKSGDTTEDGLNRLSELNNYEPKVVLLLLGGNDSLRKVPIDTTFENLGKIIEHIHARGAVVVLLGVRGNLLNDKFRAEFENLQEKYETAYVPDVLDGLFGNTKYMSDVIHPNDAGYEMISERIYPVLDSVI